MKYQLKLFFTALMFFTRIPIPVKVGYSEELINKCNRYFSVVGIFVGVIGASVFWGSHFLFPKSISLILSMIATILTTGAFHEDGFADICDSFGGGWTKSQILTIMKDSRVGAYGVVGMILLLGLKFFLLFEIDTFLVVFTLIAAHSISRSMSVLTMYTLKYVRDEDDSKSKPVTKNLRSSDLYITLVIGITSIVLMQEPIYFIAILPLLITVFFLNRYFKKWIGGYTGDCLGTVQQVTEIVFYLSILAIQQYV